jgi:hypothetical protein
MAAQWQWLAEAAPYMAMSSVTLAGQPCATAPRDLSSQLLIATSSVFG